MRYTSNVKILLCWFWYTFQIFRSKKVLFLEHITLRIFVLITKHSVYLLTLVFVSTV